MKKRIVATAICVMTLSAAAVVGVAQKGENVNNSKNESETVYYESENNITDKNNMMDSLATLPSEEYQTYVAKGDTYLSDIIADNSKAEAQTQNVESEETKEEVKEDNKEVAEDKDSQSKDNENNKPEEEKKEEESEYANVAISMANSYVNVRGSASEDGEILGKLYRGSIGEIIARENGWVKIKSGTVTGYVKADYIASGKDAEAVYNEFTRKIATINTTTLRVRSSATTDSKVLAQVAKGEKFEVVKEKDGWCKIDVEGTVGYVSSEYVTFTYDYDTAISIEEEKKAIEEAKAAEEAAKKAEEAAKKAEEAAKKAAEEAKRKEAEKKAKEEAAKKEAAKKEAEKNKAETVIVNTGSATSYTAEDIKLLTCVIQAEAGGESYEGKLAVANVVLNRVKSSRYPNSIKGVIYQKGQFGVVKSGSLARRLRNYTASGSSYKAAKAALEGKNNIGSRKSFNNKRVAGSRSNSVVIGNHKFW